MEEMYSFRSEYGFITVVTENEFITRLAMGKIECESAVTPLAIKAEKQLNEFFSGERIKFDLPIAPKGTEFQKKVWDELTKIPYGTTVSYKYIATRIGSPRASRAVGMANNKNPIPVIIPCHRVIGKDNRLVGYAYGLDMKRSLLELENNTINMKG